MSYVETKKTDHDFSLVQWFGEKDRVYPLHAMYYNFSGCSGPLRKKWNRSLLSILKIILGTGCCVAFQWSYALCSGTNCSCSVEGNAR